MNGFTFTQDADDPAIFAAADRRRRRVMRGPARLLALLAVAAATRPRASRRLPIGSCPPIRISWWRTCGRRCPTTQLRELIARWRADPTADATSVALADALTSNARAALREPHVLRSRRSGARAAARRSRAPAPRCAACMRDPAVPPRFLGRRSAARRRCCARRRTTTTRALLRASVRLVRGDFAGARADCAQLAAGGGGAAAHRVRLPRRGAGRRRRARAGAGVARRPIRATRRAHDAATRAYLLATRAELRERADDLDRRHRRLPRGADARAARRFDPRRARRRARWRAAIPRDARELLDVDKPSLALLVRSAALCRRCATRDALRARAAAWLALEARARRCHPLPRSGDAGAGQRRCRARAGGGAPEFRGAEGTRRRAGAGARRARGARRRRLQHLRRVAARAPDIAIPSRKAFSTTRRAVRVCP